MRILIGGFLILFGIVWTGILLAVAYTSPSQPAGALKVFQGMMGLGGILFAMGVLLVVTGLISARKTRKKALEIYQRGTPAKATVTYADKNYKLLVNNKPIYSIIEFTFQDSAGKTHTARKDNVESDLVIRCRIEVGSQLDLKYLPENPADNVLLIKDPPAG